MRLLPFARAMPDCMHLRIARLTPRQWASAPLTSTYGIFRGTYRHPDYSVDFVGKEFAVELIHEQDDGDRDNAPSSALQLSGEALGDRHSFKAKIAGSVRFVDFLGPPAPIKGLLFL